MNETEQSAIACFARACEDINTFAHALRESHQFGTVRTGADVRYYENGWRLEKWVEAELRHVHSTWAVWWVELGPSSAGWGVYSNLAVSPDVLFIDLAPRYATTVTELRRELASVVDEFNRALTTYREFAKAVRGE